MSRPAMTTPPAPPRVETRLVDLPGGRLAVGVHGPADGLPLLYCHGLPGSRLQRHPDPALAATAGVRVYAPDRPGYGLSARRPGRRVADWPELALRAADFLGLDRFLLLGVSGGGPYAAALAAAAPDRVLAVALVSPLGDLDGPRAARLRAWPPRPLFLLSRRSPGAAARLLAPLARALGRRPADMIRLAALTLPGPDTRALGRPEVRRMMAEDLAEATRQGPAGAVDDLAAAARPWGLGPEAIACPTASRE